MALNAPQSVEVEQIQFKLHDQFEIFEFFNVLRNNVNLLATSSTNGLVFVGMPQENELRVIQLKNLVEARESDGKLYARSFKIPSKPNCLQISCDGQLLAVNYTLNNSGFLAVYDVASFYSTNIIQKYSIKVSEDNSKVVQLLWNPIISNTIAIILSDGAVQMYNLKDGYEFHSLEKTQQVLCGCWSPKGKQIVFGFRNGKIIQFKPDLKPARIIECPSNIIEGPFKTIAIQWLSTYQFAVSFLQDGEDMTANLFIVNAPKSGQSTYINYYDICYSSSGPRCAQVFFIHLQIWNILLVANSNSMEVGILGTSETGEAPSWTEYNLNDSCRLNLPMTKYKQETYPIGFCLELGSIHQLIIGENEMPVMPMIHVLSTHGQLIIFDFLNLFPNTPNICSPPNTVNDQSGLRNFKEIIQVSEKQMQNQLISNETNTLDLTNANKNSTNLSGFGELTTPAKSTLFSQSQTIANQTKPAVGYSLGGSTQLSFGTGLTTNENISVGLFGNNQPKFGSGIVLGGVPSQSTSFINSSSENQNKPFVSFGNMNLTPLITNTDINSFVSTTATTTTETRNDDPEKNKPLFTVQPTFTPPAIENFTIDKIETNKNVTPTSSEKINLKDPVNRDYIQEMIQTEIQCFELELKELSSKSKDVNISIGNMENIKNYTKKIDELQATLDKSQDNEFDIDMQVLKHSINECFTMVVEVRSKLEFFENPGLSKIVLMPSNDQTSRRQLSRLNSMLAINEAHLKIIKQQIDANWSDFQDIVHRNSTTKMHIPSLEGIYQTMTKQKNILAKERQKIAHIKLKLNFPGLHLKNISNKKSDINADSLADSILSMSLSDQISKENSKLSREKLLAIRDVLENRKIIKITPQRPDRLESEIILRSKLKSKKIESQSKIVKNDINRSKQINPGQKVEYNNSCVTVPKEIVNMKIQQPEISQLNNQTINIIKTQIDKTPISLSTTVISNKSSDDNISGVSFGNIGLNLTKPNISDTDNKSIIQNTSILYPRSQSSATPININQTIMQTKALDVSNAPNSITSSTATLSFGNLANTLGSNSPFNNLSNKNSFTPVTSIQSFGGGMSGLTFNTKTNQTVQAIPKTQEVQDIPILSKQISLFEAPAQTSSPTFSNSSIVNQPTFSSKSPSNHVFASLESQSKPEVSYLNKNSEPSTDTFLENLNICKPSTKVAVAVPNANIFGTGVFSLNSQNSNIPNTSLSESKTNFLSTFSSTSKSLLFGSTQIISGTNTNSSTPATLPFGSIQNTITSSVATTTDSGSNKSVFTSITALSPTLNSDVSKTLFNSAKTSSILSFGSIENSLNPQTVLQPNTNNESESNSTVQSKLDEISSTVTPFVPKTITDSTTSSFFGNLTGNSSTTTSETNTPLFGNQVKSNGTAFKSNLEPSTTVNSENKPLGSALFGTPNIATTTGTLLPSLIPSSSATTTFSTSSITPATSTSFSFLSLSNSSFPSLLPTNTTTAISPTSSISFGVPVSSTSSVSSPFSISGSTVGSNSIFGGSETVNSTNITSPTATTTTTTITINTGNIFSGIPKPDQSVFGQSGTFGNIFAQSAQTSQFSQKASVTSPSIFGGNNNTTVFGGLQQTSSFGNVVPVTNSGLVFAGTSEQKADTGPNIFGSPVNTTNSGSIFSSSPFSLTTTSDHQNTANIFECQSSENLTFGNNIGNSIFGGGGTNSNQSVSTSPFTGGGSFSSEIGTGGTNFGDFGTNTTQNQSNVTFAQGGTSVSQTTFGSPNATVQKPTFGGPPTFGSPSTFGSSSTFGGVPTFGSGIKAFGGFSSPTNASQPGNVFGSPTQKSDYFEALGSSNDSLSFGNLAQNANANASKPNFGAGSSFSNWR